MIYGLNLLLWTTEVNETHFPLLDDIRQWGYDAVEIPVFNLDPALHRRVGAHLDGLGLKRSAVTVCSEEANPIDPSPTVRLAARDYLMRVVDACQAGGIEKLVGPIHSAIGKFTGTGPTPQELAWARETLLPVANHAREAGVMLVFEYLNRFECYLATSAAEAAQFVREVDHPNLRMMYDTFHANIEEKCVASAIRECADVCVHVHISENDRSTPGEGHVDWETTFRTLKETGYDDWLVIEAFGLALPAIAAATKIWRRMFPNEEHLARRGLAFMKQHWEGTGAHRG
jgi:D-psicose/D-tagatose/L-ribulose 3-epimerase